MELPKTISPDRIRDSIVEVRYDPKVPFEVAVGMIFNALDNSYIYTNRPPTSKQHNENEVSINLGGYNLFYNDKIKLQLTHGSLIFNCRSDEYLGWDMYLPEIKKVLEQILAIKVVGKFTRIGIRYISDYENMSLSECINFSFSFGMPNVTSKQFSFKTEFFSDDIRIIMNLGDNVPKKSLDTNKIVNVTSIDIDAILVFTSETNNLKDVINHIETVHGKEKEMFFKLIKQDFLKKLNPQY